MGEELLDEDGARDALLHEVLIDRTLGQRLLVGGGVAEVVHRPRQGEPRDERAADEVARDR